MKASVRPNRRVLSRAIAIARFRRAVWLIRPSLLKHRRVPADSPVRRVVFPTCRAEQGRSERGRDARASVKAGERLVGRHARAGLRLQRAWLGVEERHPDRRADRLQTPPASASWGCRFRCPRASAIAAGAPQAAGGAVLVCTEPAGGWANATGSRANQIAELTASDRGGNDYLGDSVSVSPAGKTIAGGAPSHSSSSGAIYVFSEPGSGWQSETQTAELTASDGATDDELGTPVAISSDGSTIGAGAIGPNSSRVPRMCSVNLDRDGRTAPRRRS
jgi:FG-GAP repeat